LLDRLSPAAVSNGDFWAADGDWDRAIAVYSKLVTAQPADGVLLTKLATAYQAVGRTREGILYLMKASAADPRDTFLSMKVAALQAWFGQEKEFAATRRRILAFAKGTGDRRTADHAAKSCSLRPSTDRAELEAALTLGRTAATIRVTPWTLMSRGMAEYRSGHDAAADQALLGASAAGPDDPYVTCTSAFYRAMILWRQGKPEEARQLAITAAAKMKPLPEDEQNPLSGASPHDDLVLWLAYKEAKAMIQFDAAPAAANRPQERAAALDLRGR
jgi:tetratricopeptide (TPR) repeat protein